MKELREIGVQKLCIVGSSSCIRVSSGDGIDRGLMFAFVGAHPGRQFEFVQSEWLNGGEFLGLGDTKDPIVGAHEHDGTYAIPTHPIARRPQPRPPRSAPRTLLGIG